MKILIVGERYSLNLGDPIICESVEYLVKQKYPQASIKFLDLSARNQYKRRETSGDLITASRIASAKKKASHFFTKTGIDTEYLKFKRSHEKKKSYFNDFFENEEFDLAIFAGGQMFKDTFVFPIATVVEKLNEINVPVIFNACGVGKIASSKMRSILKSTLLSSNIKFISSRDDVDSLNKLLGNHETEVIRTVDPAVWTKKVYNIEEKKSDVIGLGIMYDHNMKYMEMVEFWKKITQELSKRKIKWKFFCNGPEKDYEFAKHILRNIGYKEKEIEKYIVNIPDKPEQLVQTIAKFKGIISFRLHSHIIAYSLNVPGVAINWDNKLQFFYKSIHLPERCFNLKTEINEILEGLELSLKKPYDEKTRKEHQSIALETLISSIYQCVKV